MSGTYKGARNQEWRTPAAFVRGVELMVGHEFSSDVAASHEAHVCPVYYTREMDGLTKEWSGVVWCNPPYNNISPWIEKARASKDMKGAVFLLPSRTGTAWFKSLVDEDASIAFLRGRLSFDAPDVESEGKVASPFDLILVGFGVCALGVRAMNGVTVKSVMGEGSVCHLDPNTPPCLHRSGPR